MGVHLRSADGVVDHGGELLLGVRTHEQSVIGQAALAGQFDDEDVVAAFDRAGAEEQVQVLPAGVYPPDHDDGLPPGAAVRRSDEVAGQLDVVPWHEHRFDDRIVHQGGGLPEAADRVLPGWFRDRGLERADEHRRGAVVGVCPQEGLAGADPVTGGQCCLRPLLQSLRQVGPGRSPTLRVVLPHLTGGVEGFSDLRSAVGLGAQDPLEHELKW